MMNAIVKRVLIAAGLLVVCVALLAGVKSFGIWVISGAAVILFIVGMVANRKPSGREDRERDPGPGGHP